MPTVAEIETESTPQPASLLKSTWTNSALAGGLLFFAGYRAMLGIGWEWFMTIPFWVMLVLTAIAPYTVMLIYPLITHRQEGSTKLQWPKFGRVAAEAGWALLVVVGCYVALFVVAVIIALFFPNVIVVPDAIFCRGFLFNAFRQRMPLALAVIASSVIFGFAHTMGLLHALATTVLGVVLALVYVWRKTILAPIFVHMLINTISSLGTILAMQAYADAPAIGVYHADGADECVIGSVTPGSPAEWAGLEPGDTIIQLGEYGVVDYQSLIDAIRMYQPGDAVDVIFIRDGTHLQSTVELISRRDLMP